MPEESLPFDHNKLSSEDLEVLRTFLATDDFETLPPDTDQPTAPLTHPSSDPALALEDEMLTIFISEVEEDLVVLRGSLEQAERDELLDSPGFLTLQRVAHKIGGTAAAIGCDAISTIAHHIELVIQHITTGKISLLTGLYGLGHAEGALEMTLQSVVQHREEDMLPLLALEHDFETLDIHLTTPGEEQITARGGHGRQTGDRADSEEANRTGGEAAATGARVERARATGARAIGARATARVAPTIHDEMAISLPPLYGRGATRDPGGRPGSFDLQHVRQQYDQLIQHTEQLIDQQTALEYARKQVEAAFQELHAAQARLRRIETFFFRMSMTAATPAHAEIETASSSSLVARILREAAQRTGHAHQLPVKTMSQTPSLEDAARWDELEMDRFGETNLLAHALNEAIGDMATATAQLERALAHLDTLVGQHIATAQQVRASALSLRTAPFSMLAQHARQTTLKVAQVYHRELQFEASGEAAEIDQDILEALDAPITQLISTQLAESLRAMQGDAAACRIGLSAHAQGDEVIIELNFSIPMPGGILATLQECVQPLHGLVTTQPGESDGITFRLHFPQATGLVQGLLVRAWEQQVIIPFSQVLRIDYQQQHVYGHLFTLNTLLGFPATSPAPATSAVSQMQPVLRLSIDSRPGMQLAVQVDEVIGQIELLIKPPPIPLRRPGVTGMAIDSEGNVLLVLDVPELIRQDRQRQGQARAASAHHEAPGILHRAVNATPKILIVDDSVTIRRSIRQTLGQKDYLVLEARDGLEALEKIEQEAPSLLLLDLEMPRMNGYDVLNILHTRALLPEFKIALLTSRTSEKHKQRARELGAHAFLTKPCSDDTLLLTVAALLAS
ncbi:MAG TPA: response regulator [Ktedonobacteraceae bacterium]|nr:response regulator [Ktedonobacteraceae bacterium]